MTNEEFIENMTKSLNNFLVELLRQNDFQTKIIEKMVASINRELGSLIEEVHLVRGVINEQWDMQAIKRKKDKVREILKDITSLCNPGSLATSHFLDYIRTDEYKAWYEAHKSSEDLDDPTEDARQEEFIHLLKGIEEKLLYVLEIKDVDDFML